ncbi:MAG: gliding motility lipoprotein GldD [Flavobacteriales bacterium]
MYKTLLAVVCAVFVFMSVSCEADYQPKPKGYHRIATLDKTIIPFNEQYPYTFNMPSYLEVEHVNTEKYWINLHSDYYNTTLHLTYKPIHNDLENSLRNFTKLTYEHTKKADGIEEIFGEDIERKVYSIFYELKGPSASSLQFIATDSFNHILRGSLYFNNIPNVDSIKPVHKVYKEDIKEILRSLEWKSLEN